MTWNRDGLFTDSFREGRDPRLGVGLPLTSELRRVSWGAILAGVVVALAVQILLAMLGTGIGLGVHRAGAAR